MLEKKTTELPAHYFREARFCKNKGREKEILELGFVGFSLKTTFEQNIVLMKTGEIVFCDKFISSSETNVDHGNQPDRAEQDGDETPLIFGYIFGKVRTNIILKL